MPIKRLAKNALRYLRLQQWKYYQGGPVSVRTGAQLYFNPQCDTSRKLYCKRYTQPEMIAFFSRLVVRGSTVIDIGANIGYLTTHFSRCVGDTGRVLAFEPDSRSFHFLQKNLELNRCENTQAYPLAISDTTGTSQLFLSTHATGNNTLYEPTTELAGDRPDELGKRSSVFVESTTLDNLLKTNDISPISKQTILKIDIEGFELKALRGGSNFFQRTDNLIAVIEYSPQQLLQAGTSVDELVDFCGQQHLSMFKFGPSGTLSSLTNVEFIEITEKLISNEGGQHDDLVLINQDRYTLGNLFL